MHPSFHFSTNLMSTWLDLYIHTSLFFEGTHFLAFASAQNENVSKVRTRSFGHGRLKV